MGVEEERQFIHELVDKAFDAPDAPTKASYLAQIQVGLRNYMIGNVISMRISEIHGDPQKGVVTPLE